MSGFIVKKLCLFAKLLLANVLWFFKHSLSSIRSDPQQFLVKDPIAGPRRSLNSSPLTKREANEIIDNPYSTNYTYQRSRPDSEWIIPRLSRPYGKPSDGEYFWQYSCSGQSPNWKENFCISFLTMLLFSMGIWALLVFSLVTNPFFCPLLPLALGTMEQGVHPNPAMASMPHQFLTELDNNEKLSEIKQEEIEATKELAIFAPRRAHPILAMLTATMANDDGTSETCICSCVCPIPSKIGATGIQGDGGDPNKKLPALNVHSDVEFLCPFLKKTTSEKIAAIGYAHEDITDLVPQFSANFTNDFNDSPSRKPRYYLHIFIGYKTLKSISWPDGLLDWGRTTVQFKMAIPSFGSLFSSKL